MTPPGFNLDDYEPVEDRLRAFWEDHPDGRIDTLLIEHTDGSYIMKALVWSDGREQEPTATGFAQEAVTERGVNATSALENCETSAIGRALANLGYAAKGKRPSREEISKTSEGGGRRGGKASPPPSDTTSATPPRDDADTRGVPEKAASADASGPVSPRIYPHAEDPRRCRHLAPLIADEFGRDVCPGCGLSLDEFKALA